MEDLAALKRGLCGPQEEQKCRAEFGENIAWACGNCHKKRGKDLSDYTKKLLVIRRLKMAGYPFGRNDLTLEDWIDLGLLDEALM